MLLAVGKTHLVVEAAPALRRQRPPGPPGPPRAAGHRVPAAHLPGSPQVRPHRALTVR